MKHDDWDRINQLFHAARALETEQRETYLQHVCEDHELRQELLQLLSYVDAPEDKRLQTPIHQSLNTDFVDRLIVKDPHLGKIIGPYRIERRIGDGGFGDVYLGIRTSDFAHKVAIKILRSDHRSTETILRRFEMERQVLADLNHECIARLVDGGCTDDGYPYIVMEYVAGASILRYSAEAHLDIRQRLDLFRMIVEGVAYAHRFGIVHRDIKPENILVNRQGVPKLVDFGVAKLTDLRSQAELLTLTREGLLPLTPQYASPEQIRGEPVGLATDVYSLGVVLYELLTGERPYQFSTKSPADIAYTICHEHPLPPSQKVMQREIGDVATLENGVQHNRGEGDDKERGEEPTEVRQRARRLKGDLDKIVLMALRKEPERRYHNAADLNEDLRRHLSGEAVAARGDSIGYQLRTFVRRNRAWVAAAVVILVALFTGTVVSSLAWRKALLAYEGEQRARIRIQQLLYASEMERAFDAFQHSDFRGTQHILRRLEQNRFAAEDNFARRLLNAVSSPPRPHELEAHQGQVNELAVVPGKPWVVSAGDDHRVLIWNTDTGKLVKQLTRCKGPVHSLAVSTDGRYLLVGREEVNEGDTDIDLWDLTTFRFIRTIHRCSHVPEALAFSHDGQRAAIGSRYDDVFVINLKSGQLESRLTTAARYWNIAFLESGELVVPTKMEAGNGGNAQHLIGGKAEYLIMLDHELREVGKLEAYQGPDLKQPVDCFALSLDQSWLISAGERSSQITVFDLADRRQLAADNVGAGHVRCVTISPDRRRIAAGFDDGTVLHWQVRRRTHKILTLELVRQYRFRAHTSRVQSLQFTARGQLLSCGKDGMVKIWPPHMQSGVRSIGPPEETPSHRIHHSQTNRLLLECLGGRVWMLPKAEADSVWQRVSVANFSRLNAASIAPHGDELAVCDGNLVAVLNAEDTTAKMKFVYGQGEAAATAFSPDARWLAVTGSDNRTCIWDLHTEELHRTLSHSGSGSCLAFSRHRDLLAVGTSAHQILVATVSDDSMRRTLPISAATTCLAWRRDDSLIASGHFNGDVWLHPIETDEEPVVLRGHQGVVMGVAFSPQGEILLTGSYDGSIRVWHIPTQRMLGILHRVDRADRIVGLEVSEDGSRLIAIVNRSGPHSVLTFPTAAP